MNQYYQMNQHIDKHSLAFILNPENINHINENFDTNEFDFAEKIQEYNLNQGAQYLDKDDHESSEYCLNDSSSEQLSEEFYSDNNKKENEKYEDIDQSENSPESSNNNFLKASSKKKKIPKNQIIYECTFQNCFYTNVNHSGNFIQHLIRNHKIEKREAQNIVKKQNPHYQSKN